MRLHRRRRLRWDVKQIWRIWAKSLGAKEGNNDREADIIACIRTFILFAYMVTNVAIVANAVRHWNDEKTDIPNTHLSRTCQEQ